MRFGWRRRFRKRACSWRWRFVGRLRCSKSMPRRKTKQRRLVFGGSEGFESSAGLAMFEW